MDKKAIQTVLDATNPMDYVLSRESSEDLGDRLLRLREFVEGRGIIEIGSARTGILPYIMQIDVPSYIGVDPFAAKATRESIEEFLRDNPQWKERLFAVSDDGLTFLGRQPTGSAIVVSSGVLDTSVIGGKMFHNAPVAQYMKELSSEIYRVTPANGISYHRCASNVWQKALIAVGFKADEIDNFLFSKEA